MAGTSRSAYRPIDASSPHTRSVQWHSSVPFLLTVLRLRLVSLRVVLALSAVCCEGGDCHKGQVNAPVGKDVLVRACEEQMGRIGCPQTVGKRTLAGENGTVVLLLAPVCATFSPAQTVKSGGCLPPPMMCVDCATGSGGREVMLLAPLEI